MGEGVVRRVESEAAWVLLLAAGGEGRVSRGCRARGPIVVREAEGRKQILINEQGKSAD